MKTYNDQVYCSTACETFTCHRNVLRIYQETFKNSNLPLKSVNLQSCCLEFSKPSVETKRRFLEFMSFVRS
jgi:hypothetical protein